MLNDITQGAIVFFCVCGGLWYIVDALWTIASWPDSSDDSSDDSPDSNYQWKETTRETH